LFPFLVIGAQIFSFENLETTNTIGFSIPNSSEVSVLFQNMTAIIEIPRKVIENQLNHAEGKIYILYHLCPCVFFFTFIAAHESLS